MPVRSVVLHGRRDRAAGRSAMRVDGRPAPGVVVGGYRTPDDRVVSVMRRPQDLYIVTQRFSRRNSTSSSGFLLDWPSRSPASTSACFTHSRTAVSVRSKSRAT
jgi:hypothetical protein